LSNVTDTGAGAARPPAGRDYNWPVNVRRVVTGHDAAGRSVFASDDEVAPIVADLFAGWAFHALWGADTEPVYPDDGRQPDWSAYFPPPGGLRFSLSTIPPEGTAPPEDLDVAAAEAQAEQRLPGLLGVLEPGDPGMHTTDTIDLEVILRGEVILELDDGAETVLRAGDTVVQNGTRHRWRNPGAEPAVMAVFMVGARRDGR
jgi:mannose-6-phosphate isomerase-like protein (cupin superfamily)